jgi:hypothetical protein
VHTIPTHPKSDIFPSAPPSTEPSPTPDELFSSKAISLKVALHETGVVSTRSIVSQSQDQANQRQGPTRFKTALALQSAPSTSSISPVVAPLLTNDASECPPTSPQHRCSCSPTLLSQQTCKSRPLARHLHTSPRQSRCCHWHWFFRFVLQKDINRLSAAKLHDTHTKIRKLQTATLKVSRRPQRCLSPFIFWVARARN